MLDRDCNLGKTDSHVKVLQNHSDKWFQELFYYSLLNHWNHHNSDRRVSLVLVYFACVTKVQTVQR